MRHGGYVAVGFKRGLLAKKSGDLAAAKALYVRAAEGFAKSLGPTHPHTLMAQQSVASCG